MEKLQKNEYNVKQDTELVAEKLIVRVQENTAVECRIRATFSI